jgi:hypothetical protein
VLVESCQGRKLINSSTNLSKSILGNRDFHHGVLGCAHNIEDLAGYIVSRCPQHMVAVMVFSGAISARFYRVIVKKLIS